MHVRTVTVEADGAALPGDLAAGPDPVGVIVFAHGSGSSRRSARNTAVAQALHTRGYATLLLDLLTEEEAREDETTRSLRFDIDLLTRRLTAAVDAAAAHPATTGRPIGLFGASTGAAAALRTAAERPDLVGAVVGRGGRVDLAGDAVGGVAVPVLLIVGSADEDVVRLSFEAVDRMHVAAEVHLVPGATHLFPEPGALEQVAGAAMAWFDDHLGADRSHGR
ncbi:dienelactone hydrolase family protein [Nocardiopsis trehalosi]|jgi:dienelactone hydrolase|uniref:dienelactone hydrolase family protein n=1 Tax=Nocardiopsis trehalosi TaxID=109329 RepID=UPI0008365D6C|nr:dienelactone hydrolase family protein [Nocardiopsis trehalosi]